MTALCQPKSAGAPETGCSVFTTSGTTRAQKFVLHSHKSIALHASDVSQGFQLNDASSVTALALPLGGVFGFASAMGAVAAAKPIVLLSAFNPESMISLMDRYGVTQFNATDDMVAKLLDAAGNDETFRRVGLVGFAAFNAALDEFPVTISANGVKIQRAKLRELAAEVLQKKDIRDACRIRTPDAIR